MIALLWKEFRENTKWAVLAMLALGLAEFYALKEQTLFGDSDYQFSDYETLCKPTFLLVTTFGNAAVGLILGLVQILPEQRRDQWAALLHRPVTRGTIYRGKVVAGLLLTLLATALPFFACVWYVATPGHNAAPFLPGLIRPGLADLCAGAVYYLAAIYIALHRGPWYGLRAAALLTALTLSGYVSTVNQFYLAIIGSVLAGLIFFLAGWGEILGNGTFWLRPWPSRWAVLTVASTGLGMVLSFFWTLTEFTQTQDNYWYGPMYGVTKEGLPVIKTTHRDHTITVKDLNGAPILDPGLTAENSYDRYLDFSPISYVIGVPPSQAWKPYEYQRGYRNTESYYRPIFGQNFGPEYWFYVPSQRLLLGYSKTTSTLIGQAGQNGFVPVGQAKPFSDRIFSNDYYYYSPNGFFTTRGGNTVYGFDFPSHQMQVIYQDPTKVYGSGLIDQNDATRSPDSVSWVGIALLQELRIYEKHGQLLFTLPYHHDMDHWGSLSVAGKPKKDGFWVWYNPSQWIDWMVSRNMPRYLEEVDTKGNLIHLYVLPPFPPEPDAPRTWEQYLTDSWQSPIAFFSEWAYQEIGSQLGSKPLKAALDWRLQNGWGYTKDVTQRIFLSSLFFATVGLFWARWRCFSWRRALGWALLIFAFNIIGLFLFRLVADWPVLLNCPACRRLRPVDHETCPHCHALWPIPPQDGTEVLEQEK